MISNKDKASSKLKLLAIQFKDVADFYLTNKSNTDFYRKFNLFNFPSLIAVKNGKSYIFEDNFEMDSVKSFLKKIFLEEKKEVKNEL